MLLVSSKSQELDRIVKSGYFDEPNSAVSLVKHELLIWIWLRVLVTAELGVKRFFFFCKVVHYDGQEQVTRVITRAMLLLRTELSVGISDFCNLQPCSTVTLVLLLQYLDSVQSENTAFQ